MVVVDLVALCDEGIMQRKLVALYRDASPEQVSRGEDWYPAARRWAKSLARETGYSLDQVVAVLAITSPGAQLVSNLKWTETSLRSHGETPVGRFPNTNRPRIAAVLASRKTAHEYVTGPKVGAFFRAILGDESALVIDRWAFRAATDSPDLNRLRPTLRRAVESAYLTAADTVGTSLRAFQATVWIALRESTVSGRTGTVHTLQDIHALAA